jgi:ribosomal-protein-alanine N-acetyltransferase
MEGNPAVLIRAMREGDIPEVAALEREAFASEGVITPFKRELANKLATYLVAYGPEKKGPIVGYAGLWFIIDEAHLTSLAVRETERSKGIGRRLLMASLQLAVERQATMMTLEVRASNKSAQGLYEKFGFRKVGVRKGYYSDNHEDAYLMTVEGLDQAETIERFNLIQSPP